MFSQFFEFLYVFLLPYCLLSGTLLVRGDIITSLFQDKDPATSAQLHVYVLSLIRFHIWFCLDFLPFTIFYITKKSLLQ